MKKYKSLTGFIVLAGLVLSLSLTSLVQAKDGELDDNSGGVKQDGGPRPLPPVPAPGKKLTPEEFEALKNSVREKRGDLKDDLKAKREEFKTKVQTERKAFVAGLKTEKDAFMKEVKAKKDEWKLAKTEKKAEFCEKAKEIVTKRFETVVIQLEKSQGKIGEFITKLTTEGKDMTLATEALNLSKTKLDAAKSKVSEIKLLVPETCESLSSDIFEKIKLGARDVKNLLKESREALHQSVKAIKELRGEDRNKNSEQGDDSSTTPATQ